MPPSPTATARLRQDCLDVAASLGIAEDEAVRSRILSYLAFIEGTKLSSAPEGEDVQSAEHLCSASAIFLALYDDQPEAEAGAAVATSERPDPDGSITSGGGGGCCRLGDLLRQCNTGVRDFMEHITLLAGRLPGTLSVRLEGDLRVMKEAIVVTKMLHGKYRQIWDEGRSQSLVQHIPFVVPTILKMMAKGCRGKSRRMRRDSEAPAAAGGGGGSYGGEAALLAKLSASGRCPAKEVRAMSARVVGVIEALLKEGIVVSHRPYPAGSSPPTVAAAAGLVEGESTAAGAVATTITTNTAAATSPAGREGAGSSASVAGRAELVAGVFHSSVAAENADRLDACYWARVSQSQQARRGGARGGVVLDEAFVLTPDLRDTVGTPRYGGSTPRRSALTPSLSRTSRQLFQDYQKASAAFYFVCLTIIRCPSMHFMGDENVACLTLADGRGGSDSLLPPPPQGVVSGRLGGDGVGDGGSAGVGMLNNPLAARPRMAGVAVGGGGRAGPPETPVMAVMETVRWIGGLDAGIGGPPESLLRKLEKCTTFSATLLQERLAALVAKLDGPSAQQEQNGVREIGMSFRGAATPGDGGSLEAGVVGDAKRKAEALYYTTLEVLLDTETARLGSEDHSRLLGQENLHKALLACCLEAVLKASSLLSLTFPWVVRRMNIDALDLCKVLESFARFCPGLPMNLKYHLFEVQTEIVERLALETGAGVFRLVAEHKAAGAWPVPPLRETDVAPPTGSHMAGLPCSPQKGIQSQPQPQPQPPKQKEQSEQPAGVGPAAVSSSDVLEAGGEATSAAAAAACGQGSAGGEGSEAVGPKAAAARARASTLDLFFGRLMKRAAEVVAELCLRRLHLPGDTSDQVWTVVRRCVSQRTEMLRDRHLHHVVLCSTYSVCKVNSVTPEVTFKRIIEQYKQLTGAGGGLAGGVGTPRLSVVKDILLERGTGAPQREAGAPWVAGGGAGAGRRAPGTGGAPHRLEERGDIIKFYNKIYIPAMKQFVLEFKNLAGQQQGVASITTARSGASGGEGDRGAGSRAGDGGGGGASGGGRGRKGPRRGASGGGGGGVYSFGDGASKDLHQINRAVRASDTEDDSGSSNPPRSKRARSSSSSASRPPR
eukprot:g9903.t1